MIIRLDLSSSLGSKRQWCLNLHLSMIICWICHLHHHLLVQTPNGVYKLVNDHMLDLSIASSSPGSKPWWCRNIHLSMIMCWIIRSRHYLLVQNTSGSNLDWPSIDSLIWARTSYPCSKILIILSIAQNHGSKRRQANIRQYRSHKLWFISLISIAQKKEAQYKTI
jgi:hypothetical protein